MTMAVLLLLNGLLAHSKPAILLLTFATGANALALGPSIQLLLMDHSRDAEMLGSSLGQSGFNIGNALGAFLGGIPLTLGYTYASPQWVGAGLALAGPRDGVAHARQTPDVRRGGVRTQRLRRRSALGQTSSAALIAR